MGSISNHKSAHKKSTETGWGFIAAIQLDGTVHTGTLLVMLALVGDRPHPLEKLAYGLPRLPTAIIV